MVYLIVFLPLLGSIIAGLAIARLKSNSTTPVLALLRKWLARTTRNVDINHPIFAQQCVATGV